MALNFTHTHTHTSASPSESELEPEPLDWAAGSKALRRLAAEIVSCECNSVHGQKEPCNGLSENQIE